MGKKSRSNKHKQKGGAVRGLPSVDGFSSNLSASSFEPPSFIAELPRPAEGWARELKKLEKELQSTKYQDAAVVLSTAKAARIMRQFDVLEKILAKADRKGVDIEDKQLWNQLKADVASFKNTKTIVRTDMTKKFIHGVMHEDTSVDKVTVQDGTFFGMNFIQYAACRGDVELLEEVVKIGAALDFENALDSSYTAQHQGSIVSKPKGCTALILAVNGAITARNMMSIVASGAMGGIGGDVVRETYEGCVECAIQLVRLGADTSARFQFPPGGENSPIYRSWHILNLEGKRVRDVAALMGSDLFTKTVEEFSTFEHQIEHVNCRCGSRLPWKQCHAGRPSDPYYSTDNDERDISKIKWRYSPMAFCQCNTANKRLGLAGTDKIHFKCCWDETAHREYYQCDKTGEIIVTAKVPLSPMQREAMGAMKECMKGKSEDEISKMFEHLDLMKKDAKSVIAYRCAMVRELGVDAMKMGTGDNPCSKLDTWDPEVYAGVMEVMDPRLSFQWNDVHWTLPKAELLKRVDEWNEALEIYCDKIGLKGTEREDVIKLHTASPYAPCGNVKCRKLETSVKQYSRCSKCYAIAYCSSACQKEDWKNHKKRCEPGTRETQASGVPGQSLMQMLSSNR